MPDPSPGLTRPGTKTAAIADDLEARILSGEFGADGKLPSEAELCEQYKVSRITVRPALSQLIDRGLVASSARQGYFVRQVKPIVLRLDAPGPEDGGGESPAAGSWDSAVLADGRQPRTEVQVRVLGPGDPAPAEVLTRLKLSAEDLVVMRDRTCYVDDVPYMLHRSWYPEPVAAGTALMRAALQPADGGLLAAIGRPAAGPPDDYVRARMATPEEADRLRLPRVTPCLDLLRTRFDKDGTPLAVSQSLMPGDRIALAGHLG